MVGLSAHRENYPSLQRLCRTHAECFEFCEKTYTSYKMVCYWWLQKLFTLNYISDFYANLNKIRKSNSTVTSHSHRNLDYHSIQCKNHKNMILLCHACNLRTCRRPLVLAWYIIKIINKRQATWKKGAASLVWFNLIWLYPSNCLVVIASYKAHYSSSGWAERSKNISYPTTRSDRFYNKNWFLMNSQREYIPATSALYRTCLDVDLALKLC